jgi:hypothetical protein
MGPDQMADETSPGPPRDGVSRRVLLASVLAAAIAAGLVGVGVGWKIEQQRVKDDLGNIRPVGTVTAIEDDSVTVDLLTGDGTRTYVLTDQTVVDSAEEGDVSDVVEGSIVLVRNRPGSDDRLQAIEIVVLPESTTFGAGRRSRSDG